jgi:hypothetical protein
MIGTEFFDEEERCQVRAIYDELVRTGKLEKHLPEESRVVRELSSNPAKAKPGELAATDKADTSAKPLQTIESKASVNKSVARTDLSPLPKREAASVAKPARFYLAPADDLEAAPSIGPKTAELLAKQKLLTVGDFLKADPRQTAERLGLRHISTDDICDWQDQARLVCDIPELRGHDAQLLVACDYRTAAAVAEASAPKLLQQVEEVAATSEGQRILRSQKKPDLAEVEQWIGHARSTRTARAA